MSIEDTITAIKNVTITPETLARALVILAQHNVPPDMQSALVRGYDKMNIKPSALKAVLEDFSSSTFESLQRENKGTLETYYERQIAWSQETFGSALRTKGIIDHIKKELAEIEADPHDLSEWVDVVILAMDGFWRHGGKADDLFKALIAKQRKNMARTWPDWRTMSEDSAIEHDRSKDTLASTGGGDHANQ